ncbi:MAG: tetratricopeptide repeat protein [Bacteroidetes bacterium]|nr:tetratricopeptide repeat protein [Bacteroidota bacterium]
MNNNELNEFNEAVAHAETIEAKAIALNILASKLSEQFCFSEAITAAKEVLLIATEVKIDLQQGRALNILGNVSLDQGHFHVALEYFHQSLALFESLNDNSRIAVVLGNIGLVYRSISDYRNAIEYYQKALAIDEELENSSGIARHLGNIGNVYLILGDYQKALEFYHKALTLAEKLGNTSGIATHTGNIGTVYLYLEDYPNALEYFQKALVIQEQLDDKLGVAITISNIAGVYSFLKDFPKSLEWYHKALGLYEELCNKSGMANTNGNIGIVYHQLKEYSNALEHQTKALSMNEELDNTIGIAFNTSNLGALFGEEDFVGYDTVKAEEYLLRAITLNQELGTKQDLYKNHEILSELYSQIGEGTKAYHHYKIYHELEKDVQNETLKKQAEQLNYERKTTEREMQIAVDRAKHEATEQLLHNVLPPSIAAQMLGGAKLIAEKLDNVTVLFADIVGFTKLSQQISPEELVRGLDMIFSEFDILAEKYGVEKIKTIGDAYMVVAGAPIPRSDHAKVMAIMAIEMQEIIKKFSSTTTRATIEIRIGIHTGEVVAGVIGRKKFAYDLWGDAVNTASRMESHSVPGKIHVSEDFKEAVNESSFTFIPRGEIDIKGKGIMKTYFLEQSK